MAGFLTCGGILGLLSVVKGSADLSSHGFADIMQGRAAKQAEGLFDKNLAITHPATHGFGILNYAFFKTGKPGVLAGDDGWLFSTEEFSGAAGDAHRIQDKADFIIQVRDRMQARNIDLVIALIPSKARIYADHLGRYAYPTYKTNIYGDFRRTLTAAGINVPDMVAAFEKAQTDNDLLYLKTDTHWTPRGADIAARTLAKAVSVQAKTQHYHVTDTLSEHHDGDLMRFMPLGPLARSWGYDGEEIKQQKIQQKDQPVRIASNNGFLFDDQAIPFALVGTSYSANEKWGFADVLKLAFQDDVLNAADEGQGPFETMKAYLRNEAYLETPPRMVIWEIPERYLNHAYDLSLEHES